MRMLFNTIAAVLKRDHYDHSRNIPRYSKLFWLKISMIRSSCLPIRSLRSPWCRSQSSKALKVMAERRPGTPSMLGMLRRRNTRPHAVGNEMWIIHKSYTRVRSIADMPENDDVHVLAKQMKAYVQWYRQNGTEPFFHRKSGRVVLSLLHVDHKGRAEFVRGINSEVSLPTGSICAERAAIVNARTAFPNVTRKQMKGIAVLEVPLLNRWDKDTTHDLLNPLPPCGACNEWLTKIGEESPGFYVVTFQDLSLEIVQERFLFWSRQQSVTAEADLGPWRCHRCGHNNVPLSTTCQNCKVDRFSASYLHMPTKRNFLKLLQALSDGPLSAKELMTRLKLKSLSAVRQTLRRLQGGRRIVGTNPILTRDADGCYHITETGRQAWNRMQKLLVRHPKHRRPSAEATKKLCVRSRAFCSEVKGAEFGDRRARCLFLWSGGLQFSRLDFKTLPDTVSTTTFRRERDGHAWILPPALAGQVNLPQDFAAQPSSVHQFVTVEILFNLRLKKPV